MSHPITEAFLDRFTCTYQHDPNLELKRIDRVASVTNQSRFEPIHDDTVERYTAAVEDGAEFPPIILRVLERPGGGEQLVILGGNHRERAHVNAGRKTIDAYLVHCDDVTALEISYGDNATHGLPPTKAEQIAHALLLVEQHGRSMSHAARVVGINPQQITKTVAVRGVRTRAAKCGVSVELGKCGEAIVPRFASLRDDRVFTKVIRAVAANGIPSKKADKMIGDINAQVDVASALDILAMHVREHRSGGSYDGRTVGRPSTNPLMVLRVALNTVRGLNAADIVERCGTDRERRELHEMLQAGGRHLEAIAKVNQAPAAARLKAVR
jgi:uncharacterized ParB-like nuclease family protein